MDVMHPYSTQFMILLLLELYLGIFVNYLFLAFHIYWYHQYFNVETHEVVISQQYLCIVP